MQMATRRELRHFRGMRVIDGSLSGGMRTLASETWWHKTMIPVPWLC